MGKPESIDMKNLAKRVAISQAAKEKNAGIFNTYFFDGHGKIENADSVFYDPYFIADNSFEGIRTISRVQWGGISPRTLRRVAEKAWIINTCIVFVSRKIKPFLKPVTDRNQRGFIVHKIDEDITKALKDDEEREYIKNFIKNCGNYDDPDRDKFVKYGTKLLRDTLTLDQITTELQYDKSGKPCAFFAVDAATIEKVVVEDRNSERNKNHWRYLQIVNGMPAAGYTADTMIFDYQNPRTDIYHSQYGYSYVEQAIDLITQVINAFVYNSGNFTENKLPKGMLLLNGDASPDQVDEMTDYLCEIMSGGPQNQWRIPIIPSGDKDSGIEWKSINANREMEFSQWMDYLTSAVVALFGCSMDELGLQSQKSQAMFENGGQDRMNNAKSALLGDVLTFFEDYMNKIIEKINPEYVLEFVGYEKDNPNTIADLDEKEVRTWKSVNEKRAEKGLKPIDLNKVGNGADLPMNVQLVQMFQANQANSGMDGMDMGDGGDFGNEDAEGNEESFDGMEEETPDTDVMEEEPVEKSINKSMLII